MVVAAMVTGVVRMEVVVVEVAVMMVAVVVARYPNTVHLLREIT